MVIVHELPDGKLIRCKSETDGIVRMKEDDVSIRQLLMQTMAVLGSSFHPPAAGFAQGDFLWKEAIA